MLQQGVAHRNYFAGRGVRARCEYGTASVFPDPVNEHVSDIAGIFLKRFEPFADRPVFLRVFTLFQIGIHPVAVDIALGDLRRAGSCRRLFLKGGVPEIDIADAGHRQGNHAHGRCHQQDNFCAQGGFPGQLFIGRHPADFGQGRLLPAGNIATLPERFRQQAQRQGHQRHGDGFIQQVDEHIGGKLGPEQIQGARVIDMVGQRRGDACAEIEPIQRPGEHRAQAAADERKDQNNQRHTRELFKIPFLRKESGADGKQHGKTAVIGGGVIADPVDQVCEKSHDDAGNIPAQRRCQGRADNIQE